MARIALLLALIASLATPAFADDWVAQKLRGRVLELVDGAWQPVERGDAVPETHVLRTLGNTRVLFQHGSETVELGPDTQVQIFRRASDGFVIVKQYFGEVTVEADVKKVRHFAVETPYLAAVVKGTIFTVRSDDQGASVEVKRGAVAVTSDADQSSVTVRAGQQAHTGDDGTLQVSGKGTLPVVVGSTGEPVNTESRGNSNGSGHGNSGSDDNSEGGNSGAGTSGDDSSGHGTADSDDSDDSGSDNSGHGNSGHDGGDEDEDEDD